MTRKRALVLLMALVLSLGSARCSAPMAPAVAVVDVETAVDEVILELAPNLTVDEVVDAIAQTELVIIDVREDYEFNAGHITGAEWLPLGEIPDRTDEIPTDVPVILVCRSGNRSSQAYNYLTQQGFDNVHNMLGGMVEWTASGYDVEK